MGKEFYSDAISLMKSMGRGNQSSRKIVGAVGRGSMRGRGPARRGGPPGAPPVGPPRRP